MMSELRCKRSYRTGHVAPCTTDGVLATALEGCTFSCIVVWTLSVGMGDDIANGRGPVDFLGSLLWN